MGAVSRSQLMHTIPIINLPVWEGRSHTPLATNPYPSSICHCGKAEATPPLQLNPATHPSNTCNVGKAKATSISATMAIICKQGNPSRSEKRHNCCSRVLLDIGSSPSRAMSRSSAGWGGRSQSQKPNTTAVEDEEAEATLKRIGGRRLRMRRPRPHSRELGVGM